MVEYLGINNAYSFFGSPVNHHHRNRRGRRNSSRTRSPLCSIPTLSIYLTMIMLSFPVSMSFSFCNNANNNNVNCNTLSSSQYAFFSRIKPLRHYTTLNSKEDVGDDRTIALKKKTVKELKQIVKEIISSSKKKILISKFKRKQDYIDFLLLENQLQEQQEMKVYEPTKYSVFDIDSEEEEDQDWIPDQDLIRRAAATGEKGEQITNLNAQTMEKFKAAEVDIEDIRRNSVSSNAVKASETEETKVDPTSSTHSLKKKEIVMDRDYFDRDISSRGNNFEEDDDRQDLIFLEEQSSQDIAAYGSQDNNDNDTTENRKKDGDKYFIYDDEGEELIRLMGGKGEQQGQASSTRTTNTDNANDKPSSSKNSGTSGRQPGYLGDSTIREISLDFQCPVCYIADVLCGWGVPPPIDIDGTPVGSLITGEQAYSLVEALNTLDMAKIWERYSDDTIMEICNDFEIDLKDAFEFSIKKKYNLPFGVRTHLRVEQEEELIEALSDTYFLSYDSSSTEGEEE